MKPIYGIVSEKAAKPNEKIYASWAVDLKRMEIGDIVINKRVVNVPLSFYLSAEGQPVNIEFVTVNRALIGTDVLRNFNYEVNVNTTPFFIIKRPTCAVTSRKLPVARFDFKS